MCNCGTDEKFDGSNSFMGRLQEKLANDDEFVAWHGYSHTHNVSKTRKHVDSVVIEPKQLTS